MIFYWTKSNKIGSRFIRWGLGEDCSHFAVSFGQNDTSAIVVHSTVEDGVHPEWHDDFIKSKDIVHKILIKLPPAEEWALYRQVVENVIGKKYDTSALFGWTINAFKTKFFGYEEATKNNYADQSAYYCTEVLNALKEFLLLRYNLDLPELSGQVLSPHTAWEKLNAVCR